MKFDEKSFRQLAKGTENSVIRLGTTSHVVLDRHQRFIEMLVTHLKTVDHPFELEHCLEWVNSLEHDSASTLSASYIDWIALHRFIHLLADQQAGELTHWHHYLSSTLEMPKTAKFVEILASFREWLAGTGKKPETVKSETSTARQMLIYFEANGITDFSDVRNRNILDYFMSERFQGRKTRGIQCEVSRLKTFLKFVEDSGYAACHTLHDALPSIRNGTENIVTTIDKQIEKDLLDDEPDSLVNKRDKAFLLLALHAGLRTCDIRSLKFSDIDWEKETIHICQNKTGVDLEIPIDVATQNAIIDYVLNERRRCDQKYIFITSVGPAQKLERRHYRMKYRAKGTDSFAQLPVDGIHICRRTFASRLLQSGAPLPTISKMLGHINKNSVRVYLSTDEQKMKRCALSLSLIPCRREEY